MTTKFTALQLAQASVWLGISINVFAVTVTAVQHGPGFPLTASIQGALLVACGVTAWRSQQLAVRERTLTVQNEALTGRMVAERLMAETMLRRMADSAMTVEVTSDDDTGRRH